MIRAWRMGLYLGVLAFVAAAAAAEDASLTRDSSLVFGQLDNGLRYIIRQHANPPGKMALMLHVDTGSLNEADDQQGMAHFLEHLAFNGSENFPPGKVVEYFESIGMKFGGDINAFTSFNQTAYQLYTPDTQEATIDKAMLCLSDQAFRLLLLKEEIEKERGVILEEVTARKSPEQRIQEELFPKLLPGSRFAVRLPLGLVEQIEKFPKEQFESYYRTWYRPEHMTLIVVGDADPQAQIPLIRKHFGSYKPEAPLPKQHQAEIAPFTQTRAIVVSAPEITTAEVEMMRVDPGRGPVTTESAFRRDLVERIGSWIVNRRLEEAVQKGDAAYREGQVNVFSFFAQATGVAGSVNGEPKNWEKMLDQLVMAVQQAVEHGFTIRELDLARKDILSSAKLAVERESTTNARAFLMRYNAAVADGDTILSARQRLDLIEKHLPGISLEDVSKAFAANFAPGRFAYVLTLPRRDDLALPSEDALLAGARAALARKTTPIIDEERPDTLLADLPEPGKIAEQTVDADLGITSAWLENGIRLHHRFMDYKKDEVIITINLAGGEIEETAANRGITEAAAQILNQPATSRLASTAIRDLITGKQFRLGGQAQSDVLAIKLSGAPADIETGLQLTYALLTDGRLEPSAFDVWSQSTIEELQKGQTQPQFHLLCSIRQVLGGGDPRLEILTPDQVKALSLNASQQWFDRLRKEAPMEVAVVGEMPWEPARDLIVRYLGSLPARPRDAKALDARRVLQRSAGPHERQSSVETLTPTAFVLTGFFGCEETNVRDVRSLELASQILSSRLIKEIREEKQLVYSIGANSSPSSAYKDAGLFYAAAPTTPDKAGELASSVLSVLREFAEKGPSEEEMQTAKKQIANDLDKRRKEPSYWVGVLGKLDLQGRSLQDIEEDPEAYEKATADAVREAFQRYHKPDRMIRIEVKPVAPAPARAPAEADAPKEAEPSAPASE